MIVRDIGCEDNDCTRSRVVLFQMKAYSVPLWLNVDTHRLQFPESIEHFDEN